MMIEIFDGWLMDLTDMKDVQFPDESILYELEYDREVSVCVYMVGDEKGTDVEKAESLLGELEALDKLTLEKETIYSEPNIGGKATFYYIVDNENNRSFWILDGIKVKGDQYIISTLFFPHEEYKQWAIETWNSIVRLEEN